MLRLIPRLSPAAILLSALPLVAAVAQGEPASGHELLRVMRSAYADRWFKTLIFTQTTTTRDSTGKERVATWYESLRYTPSSGTQLRIDTGEPSAGNGVLYSPDSLWVFRNGKQVAVRPGGNLLLPLVEGAYVQPVERTERELAPTGVDLARPVVPGQWRGRPVWIAGARAAGDTTSPQFWVDVSTKATVRGIYSPVAGAPVMDMRLDSLVETGGGWLATRCEFWIAGKLAQTEEYHDWRTNVALPAELFDPAAWATAPHWARGH
jgi:hypothetical protein